MPIIETVEQLADFLEKNDEWRRKLFAILVPRSLQRMPEDLDEFREETRAEFKAVRQEMREGFERVDREMREGFERVDREMREGFERVDREMREGFERQGAQIKKNTDDIAELKGLSLEQKYRNQAGSWFSKYLKKVRLIELTDLEELFSDGPPLTEQEHTDLASADLFLIGIDKRDERERVYVVEISWVVDANDIERAVRRAQIIARQGLSAAAVAAGRELAADARELAVQLGCGLLIGGRYEVDPTPIG